MTPEARVKQMVRKVLKKFQHVYTFWPVPHGFGPSSLDCILCVQGQFVAIETKAPGGKLTPRQSGCVGEILRAGGVVFVIDGEAGANKLEKFLNDACSSKLKT